MRDELGINSPRMGPARLTKVLGKRIVPVELDYSITPGDSIGSKNVSTLIHLDTFGGRNVSMLVHLDNIVNVSTYSLNTFIRYSTNIGQN
jgi:hypothetical protein